tara:strand:+ start:288 stop:476 length:189 start_codon:yes stop_codon:yes gene_type:complete
MWVQVPEWVADWSKCAVDVPDSSSHGYVSSADNTFGVEFNWKKAPWFLLKDCIMSQRFKKNL